MEIPGASKSLLVIGYVFFELYWPNPERMPEPGEELFLPDIPVGLGGAANAASVAQALGMDVTLAFPKGNGLCDFALEAFLQKRLGLSLFTWPAKDNTAITLIMNETKDRCFLSKADENAFADLPALPRKDVVLVGLHEAWNLAPMLRTMQQDGCSVCLSGGFRPDLLRALGKTPPFHFDLLLLNEKEADLVAPGWRETPSLFDAISRDVVVTLGEQGAVGWIGKQECRAASVPTTVLDTTGAGDAFAGAFLSRWSRGVDGQKAMETACQVASRMLVVRGGVVPTAGYLDDIGI